MTKKELDRFKSGVLKFWGHKMAYRIARGDFDSVFKRFLEGDSISFDLSLSFIPNDVIFMNALIGNKISPTVLRKVRRLWDKERL